MFGNLVQIELIRLLKSKALKIGVIVGAFLIIVSSLILELLIISEMMNAVPLPDISPAVFRNSIFTLLFGFVSTCVACVSVVYTTCVYHSARLAVNIECAVRSRIKLYMSEIAGIAVFVLCLNLLMFPGLLAGCLIHPSDADVLFQDLINTVYTYLIMSLNSFAVCVVSYLIAKVTDKAMLSLLLVFVTGIAGVVGLIFISGAAGKYTSDGNALPEYYIDGILTAYYALPMMILAIMLAVKNRRTDRI